MKKIFYVLIIYLVLASCSGPRYFNSPTDFMGGNKAAAVETHCARQIGDTKDSLVYKLCKQSYNTHYGK